MKRLLLFAALIAWSGMASAVVYKWVDAQGKLQYGDRPPDGVHAEVVELLIPHSASTRSASTAAPAPRQKPPPSPPKMPRIKKLWSKTLLKRATNNVPRHRIATRN